MSKPFELAFSNSLTGPVVTDLELVDTRLQELHPTLNRELLADVVAQALNERNDVTEASAPTEAGVLQWLKTVKLLRTWLSSKDWSIQNTQNCPFIVSPDRSVSIVILTGSSETGRQGFGEPTNQAEKGAVAERFVQNNQLALFNQDSFKLAKEKQKETQVWALLYHYDKKLNEVRFELSLPTAFGKKKITAWGERLILGSIPNNTTDFTIREDVPNAPATVEVQPKTGTN
ncbi:hypothetical protein AS359_04390 [Comamonas kerstersii]|uniref:Uncharacterized protein n=1 Tax=Comamonas kerstersii TaxID=225992 RepID=A0A0W7YSG9_9BURK|nr:hypothetical protein [Comamonas kerstersii]KUF38039.1 hypothetical protein AS359_04390 [Comamonas kerstersii]